MDTGCGALVGKLEDMKLALKNPRDDDGNSDSGDGCDGAELLAAAEEGRGADDVLSILEKIPVLIRRVDFVEKQKWPRSGSALADVEMEAVNQDLTVASRNVRAQRIELEKAIKKGEEDVLITGLLRDGKELLWHQDPYGVTLLHAAVTAPKMGLFRKLVQFMIRNGLTDAALLGDRYGNTALHRATEIEEFSKAICLIKAEPRTVYQVNHSGESPLYLAVRFRHEDLVKHMVTQSCLPACAQEMRLHPKHATLLHLAIKARSFGILKLLLKHLPELVKGKDERGWRPLSYAANKGYLDEVTYILTNFPKSAEKRDKDGSFPIHKAIGGGHVSIVKAFYELCPQTLHHIDRKGRSVLHIAASYDRADILTYLTNELKLDDSLSNRRDNVGKTFMDYAKELKN